MLKKRKKANSKPIEGLTELLGCTPVDYGDSEKFSLFKSGFASWCEKFTKSTEIDDRNSDYADPTVSNMVDYETERFLLERAEHEFSIGNLRTNQIMVKSQLESEIAILTSNIVTLKEELKVLKELDKSKNNYA